MVGAFHEITATNKSGGRTRSVTFLIKDTRYSNKFLYKSFNSYIFHIEECSTVFPYMSVPTCFMLLCGMNLRSNFWIQLIKQVDKIQTLLLLRMLELNLLKVFLFFINPDHRFKFRSFQHSSLFHISYYSCFIEQVFIHSVLPIPGLVLRYFGILILPKSLTSKLGINIYSSLFMKVPYDYYNFKLMFYHPY